MELSPKSGVCNKGFIKTFFPIQIELYKTKHHFSGREDSAQRPFHSHVFARAKMEVNNHKISDSSFIQELYYVDSVLFKSRNETVVFSAIERKNYRPMVFKKIEKLCPLFEEEAVENEIKILTLFKNEKYIVSMENWYETDDLIFLLFEKLGYTLLNLSKVKEGRFLETDVIGILKCVLKALCVCHDSSIVHRDVKLENIMSVDENFGQNKHVKLIDFGLSCYLDNDQKTCGFRGTEGYFAPEIVAGRYGCRIDIWSLGVVTYAMLFGKKPYPDEKRDFSDFILEFPLEMNMGLGLEWKIFIRKCLQLDPEERFTSHEALKFVKSLIVFSESHK